MIPIYKPSLSDIERKYLIDAYDSSWIMDGKYITKSEEFISNYLDIEYVQLVSNGTNALHLALRALNIGPGDKIVVPNITFTSTAFAVSYVGAEIILVDIDENNWNINLNELENICKNTVIKAVIPVHLMGVPVDMEKLLKLKEKYDFYIIEDACESFGADLDGRQTGTFGDIGCFSFYSNKTITAGNGGAIVTSDEKLYKKMFKLSHQAHSPGKRYWHEEVGYNYKITNLQAAILYGQLNRLDEILNRKREIYNKYKSGLKNVVFQDIIGNPSYWMMGIITGIYKLDLIEKLKDHDIDSRPMFYPLSKMGVYKNDKPYINSEYLSYYGIMLPSFPNLKDEEIDYIVSVVNRLI